MDYLVAIQALLAFSMIAGLIWLIVQRRAERGALRGELRALRHEVRGVRDELVGLYFLSVSHHADHLHQRAREARERLAARAEGREDAQDRIDVQAIIDEEHAREIEDEVARRLRGPDAR